jgi:hypothetical protein
MKMLRRLLLACLVYTLDVYPPTWTGIGGRTAAMAAATGNKPPTTLFQSGLRGLQQMPLTPHDATRAKSDIPHSVADLYSEMEAVSALRRKPSVLDEQRK